MDMDHGGMDHGGGTGCKMSMLWNWNTIDACFLTSSWHITSQGAFAATCIGVMVLVVILEFLRRAGNEYDALILRQFKRHVEAQRLGAAGKKDSPRGSRSRSREPEPEEATPARPQVITFRASPLQQLVRCVIHAVTVGLGYIVMLLAMNFNGYIIICIIIGAGIGKFLCDWMVHRIVIDVDQMVHRIVIDVDQPAATKVDGIEDIIVSSG